LPCAGARERDGRSIGFNIRLAGRIREAAPTNARSDIVSSPENLYAFATGEFLKIFALASTVERCVTKALGG
jgi:hypothetical protein